MNNVEFPNATASALMGLKSMPSRFEGWLPWLVSIYWQPLWWRLLWGWLIQQCIVLKSVGCTRTLLSMDAVWNLRERVYSCSARVLFGFCWVWLRLGFILFGFLLSINSGKLNTLKLIPLYVHNRKSSGELFSAAFFWNNDAAKLVKASYNSGFIHNIAPFSIILWAYGREYTRRRKEINKFLYFFRKWWKMSWQTKTSNI